MYKKIVEYDILNFIKIVGEKNVLIDKYSLKQYSHDETEDLSFLPEVVLKPINTDHVSKILSYCNENLISITPIGGKTGLSGGALPVNGGVSLSMEKMNNIIKIDEENFQAIVEPGVITQVLQEKVKEFGLFYPPDPSSRGSCFLGGNIGYNAGGPKAVKYGVTKDYILNLEVVLPNGNIIWTGANVLKNSTGYNLTQLFVGSEGTLGVITKITLKLLPFPKYDLLMLVPFYSAEDACKVVAQIFKKGIIPSGLEFMEKDAINFVTKYINSPIKIEKDIKAHLLIEVDGNDLDLLYKDCEKINSVLNNYKIKEILFAENNEEKNKLWNLRRNIAESVKTNSVYKEEDTVVPRANLPKLLKGVKNIGKKYGFKSVCYGHAGDGNLHVNILKGKMNNNKWNTEVPKGISELFQLCKKLGGTISGEHGIGFVQKNYLHIVFNKELIELQQEIKKVFDPNNILNPDKIFN